jgi:hypothetical protein
MIKLLDLLFENNVYQNDNDTWVHATSRDEAIKLIKSKGKWLGINEDPSEFNYAINTKLSGDTQNPNVPNFLKGEIYAGYDQKYLITFKPKQRYPGDNFESLNWKEVDYPLIPNSGRFNKKSFVDSSKIGVLKPEYRDDNNFRFYQYDGISKKYYEFDIKDFKEK